MNIVVLLNGQYDAEKEEMLTNINLEGRSLLEVGLKIGEKNNSIVTVLAIGSTVDERVLREAFAMGASIGAYKEGVVETDVKTIADIVASFAADVIVAPDAIAGALGEILGKPVVDFGEEIMAGSSVVKLGGATINPRHMNVKGVFTAYDKTIEAM